MGPTILDVIDNFTTSKGRQLHELPGTALWELGALVNQYADAVEPPLLRSDSHPIYLGGWPSANFWVAAHGPMVLSSLLYCGQLIAKDPLVDWFSPARYEFPRNLTDRQGYLTNEGSPNVAGTRRFLAVMIPRLLVLRPLIESGTLVLVSGEAFSARTQAEVAELRDKLKTTVSTEEVVARFRPRDLAADDRRRGMFVGAPSPDPISGLEGNIEGTMEYFAREYLLARSVGAEYTAPWDYETFLCEEGLAKIQNESASQRVVQALLRTSLPIFGGLTPRLVAQIKDDEAFGSFRSDLIKTYRDIPKTASDADVRRYIAENESALLQPQIERAELAAKRGWLARAGAELVDAAIQIGVGVAADAVAGRANEQSVAREGLGYLVDRVRSPRRTRDSLTVWTKLARHRRSIEQELELTVFQRASEPFQKAWPQPAEPAMAYTVTEGIVLFDDPPLPAPAELTGYQQGEYSPCPCGSGYKWHFCCRGVPGAPRPDQTGPR